MSQYNPKKHNRRSIRLKGYDYTQSGLYFVTICVQNKLSLFGNIEDGKMELNEAGKMVTKEWLKLPERFKNIKLHEYVVMPNHFHAILEIVVSTLLVDPQNGDKGQPQGDAAQNGYKGQPQGIAPTGITPSEKTLGDMVGAFKSITTVEYIREVKSKKWKQFDRKLWQRDYWEHIIRNEKAYRNISQYIINNPQKWEKDKLNGGKGNTFLEPPTLYGEEIWMK